VAADVVEAEAAIRELNGGASSLADTEALARLLLRAESMASSRIEGLAIGGRRLLHAEAARELGDPTSDMTAEEVLGNVAAMRWSVGELAERPITRDSILEVHGILLGQTRLAHTAGRVRTEQKLDRRERLQPVFRRLRPSAAGTGGSPAHRPRHVLR
jgi:Fic family protein